MDLRIVGVLVLPVTCIRPCLQYRCHGVDIGLVDCCWDGMVFGFAGDDFTSPYTLFLGHVCKYHFAAVLFDDLRAYRPLV